jgi:hypothetical protein
VSATASPLGPVGTARTGAWLKNALTNDRSTSTTTDAPSVIIQPRAVRNVVNSARSSRANPAPSDAAGR